MSTIDWRFPEAPPNLSEHERTDEEFFSNADVLSEVSGLVRESIQNSLDEVFDKSKPVRMVFTVGRQSSKVAQSYFGSLYDHIEASKLNEIPNFNDESAYLVIEDFNTLGLEGPTISRAPTESELNLATEKFKYSYWYFEWKTGGSPKGSGNRGSWGVGKVVFPRASRIKSYLVLSRRRPEAAPSGGESILFGHSILKYRHVNSKRLVPDCRWMLEDENQSYVPSDEMSVQAKFIRDWKLSRTSSDLGTSIVVPFCRDAISPKNLLQSIIRDYFIPILGGQLECEVRGEGGESTILTSLNLEELLDEEMAESDTRRSRSVAEIKTLCALYKAHAADETCKVELLLNKDHPNNWAEIKLPPEQEEEIANEYNRGAVIQFSIETQVPKMTNPEKQIACDRFTVLLKKELDTRSTTVFCREGILIPSANPRSKLQNCMSLVLVGNMTSAGDVDNSLANLLKLAEGPSHDRWSPDATNFKGRYLPKTAGEDVIKWVKFAAERCLRLIQGAEREEDDATLGSYFPITQGEGENSGVPRVLLFGARVKNDRNRAILTWRTSGFKAKKWTLNRMSNPRHFCGEGAGGDGSQEVDLVVDNDNKCRFQVTVDNGTEELNSNVMVFDFNPKPLAFSGVIIDRLQNGFSISSRTDSKLEIGSRFTVDVNYVSRGGKSSWIEGDFDLNDLIEVSSISGLQVVEVKEDSCTFEITESEIYVKFSGFDPLRDLLIDARKAS